MRFMEIFRKISQFIKQIINFKKLDGHYIIVFFCFSFKFKYKQKYTVPVINQTGITDKKRIIPIVASITSTPNKINSLHQVIKSLLVQDFKPDYLILYLSDKQFKDREGSLPDNLLDLKRYGLEIRWCSDVGNFKRLVPALRDFKNAIIITFDDSVFYKKDAISILYNSYLDSPDCIIANRIERLKIKGGKIREDKTYKLLAKKFSKPSYMTRPVNSGGVLYPPDCFNEEIFNDNVFYNLAPNYDDIWYWAMAVLNNTKTKVSKGYRNSLIKLDFDGNINETQNLSINEAYKIILDKYPEVYEKLKH